jgi:uncharacterized protein (TIGR00645 family)
MSLPSPGKEALWGKLKDLIEEFILKSRMILVPFCVALLFEILTISVDFFKVLFGYDCAESLTAHTLQGLELLDITMIVNLIWLISAGSYYVFVDNNYQDESGKRRPRCLVHVSAGILKEKMAGSLIGVSSIYLLKIFLDIYTSSQKADWEKIGVLLAIYTAFIVGLLAFNHANAAPHHNHEEKNENKKQEKTTEGKEKE